MRIWHQRTFLGFALGLSSTLLILVGPGRTADVYECTVEQALTITDKGYEPHLGNSKFVSRRIMIDKYSGEVLGPLPTDSSWKWKRIQPATKVHIFHTRAYTYNNEIPMVDIFINSLNHFVWFNLVSFELYAGTCRMPP